MLLKIADTLNMCNSTDLNDCRLILYSLVLLLNFKNISGREQAVTQIIVPRRKSEYMEGSHIARRKIGAPGGKSVCPEENQRV